MRKFLAISIALLLAVIVLTPAMGYTIKSENSSYSIKSGEKANYSIGSGTPAHEITSMPVVSKSSPRYSISSEKIAYSFKSTAAPKYSIISGAATVAAAAAVQPAAQTEVAPVTVAPAAASNVTAPAAPEATAPAVSKLSISGTVYEETDNNLAKEANEMGIEGIKVNLAQPTDTIIANTTTSATGEYSFTNLMPGEYTVMVAAPEDMKVLNPADGKYTVMLTSKDEANKDFAIESVKANATSVAPVTFDKAAAAPAAAAPPAAAA
ncbi:MAG TPA: SdrD B-like domain-containing protein [Methanotrichaceae archaeon]|nr:SdrD B-like domain-containing protein [Methanotrichaceae archaeon]